MITKSIIINDMNINEHSSMAIVPWGFNNKLSHPLNTKIININEITLKKLL